jgi:hypothetical protein
MLYAKGTRAAAFCAALLMLFGAAFAAGDAPAQRRRGAKRRAAAVRTEEGRVAEGLWGGARLRLSVTGEGAQLEFDCAHGAISVPLRIDAGGRFDLPGTYTREGPGPIRIGRVPAARPARYAGRVEGARMTLSVRLEGADKPLGEYTLKRGAEGRIVKCR